jgi:4-azaleucine resistance transporter AzlC
MNWRLVIRASRFTVPVALGYIAIGTAFGLLAVNAGYPLWFAVFMSIFVFAGAAQFIAIGLFSAGASLAQIALITLVVNIRHMAYGFSLIRDFARHPRLRPYLVFALTDETYALLTSLSPEARESAPTLLGIAAFDQLWWVLGTFLGAAAGSLLPFKLEGLDFALTALFLVLAVEQYLRVKRSLPFIIAGLSTILAAWLAGQRAAIVVALIASTLVLALVDRFDSRSSSRTQGRASI